MHKEVLRMEQISVVQDETKILENTWINLFQGETIGLLGLNDSGKSAMMRVLTGLCPSYTGKIFINEQLTKMSSSECARGIGIFLIQHSLSLVSDSTISENIFFVREKGESFILNWKKRKAKTMEILSQLGIGIKEDLLVTQLTYYQKFLVELCKSVVHNAKIIVIDGILSGFSKKNVEEIKNIFLILSKRGISIILLDHRLKPITTLCKRIFILKLGRTVGVLTCDHFSESSIFSQMIGSNSQKPIAEKIKTPYQIMLHSHLELRHIFWSDALKDISLQIQAGEILGLIDVDDPIGTIFTDILSGEIIPESGSIFIDEKPFNNLSEESPYINDIGFVMEPFYLYPEVSIRENIVFSALQKKSNHLGILSSSKLKYLADELISKYISKEKFEKFLLSRGKVNGTIKEKISLCKALSKDPKCIIFVNPTQYVDIASKQEIYKDIISLKQEGRSALIISLSIDDLISVCDRVIVIKNGCLKASLSFSEISTDTFIEQYGKYLSES